MKKKVVIPTAAVVGVGIIGFLVFGGSGDTEESTLPKVKVERGTIIDKALAVGTIEPEFEISVKSKVTGVVSKIFADVGTYVSAGDPLLEVRPDPTPLELADAKRQVELADVDLENLKKERVRQESLFKSKLISDKEYEDFQKRYDETKLRLQIATENFVLNRTVEVGDPVTPLTSFQEGTVLMKMANMKRLLFKGTVDEIDVGKLREGMETQIKVGALPNDTVRGELRKIWLKAEKRDNATVFPIEILIPTSNNQLLRAGYSANANIIIDKKVDVLKIPERVVEFRNDSAFVKVPVGVGRDEERYIKTGLSDAISIEVVEGLSEGDEVFEKPVKKID